MRRGTFNALDNSCVARKLSREIITIFLGTAQVTTGQLVERKDRIRHIRLALAAPLGGFVSLVRFGALVADEEGRESPYDQSTAKRWEDGAEPDLSAIEAMVRLAQRYHITYVTRAWLAFGEAGVAEALSAPALQLHDATEEAAEAGRGRTGKTKGT